MIDVLVAGGGPIGLGVAIGARLVGLTAMVVEPRGDPIDKACGEGLMPGAVTALQRLGVQPEGWPFRGIRYISGARAVEAAFQNGPGLGVRRTALQGALVERAEALGVVRERGHVTDVQQYADHVQVGQLAARWLVAADGLHSPIRRSLGLDRPPRGRARFGQRRHYGLPPWSDFVEVHWSATAEAYVTPVGPELVGVAILCGRGRRYDDVLAEFPQLVSRLSRAEAFSVRAAGPLRQRAAAPSSGRVLLAGDAAGYVDALTGEGLATGLATAEAAVRFIVSGGAMSYDKAWLAATRRYRMLTLALLAASRRPAVRRGIVPAAERLPRAFRTAVNLLA